MTNRKYWWVRFLNEDIAEYVDKEIQKMAIDLKENLEVFRGKIYEAVVYDPDIKAKVIEFIKKNEQRTN